MACHTTDGVDLVGPSWLGIAGTTRDLESGESVLADSGYLTESIVDPPAKIAAGFNPLMPTTYVDTLTSEEIADIVEFIESLS